MTRTDTTRLYLRVSALVLGIALIAAPAVASASPWRGIGVTLHDLGLDKTPTLVVFGSLDDDLERPATVELPIPAGSRIGWVGEVFGGDPSLDRIAEFTVRPETGYDVLVITVTEAPAVQAELVPPDGWVARTDDDLTVRMSWTAHEALAGVRLGFEIPDTARPATLDPDDAQRERTPAGVLYSVETTPVAAGQTLTLDAVIVAGADPLVPSAEPTEAATPGMAPANDEAPSSSGPPLLLLVTGGGLLIAVGALIVLVNRSRSKD